MKKIWHLANCTTCQRILNECGEAVKTCELQNIKTENIAAADLDRLAKMAGSYEALFSRKALKYRELGLHLQPLAEADFRRLILEEYTFLKRPVVVNGDEFFIGNLAKTVAAAKISLQK